MYTNELEQTPARIAKGLLESSGLGNPDGGPREVRIEPQCERQLTAVIIPCDRQAGPMSYVAALCHDDNSSQLLEAKLDAIVRAAVIQRCLERGLPVAEVAVNRHAIACLFHDCGSELVDAAREFGESLHAGGAFEPMQLPEMIETAEQLLHLAGLVYYGIAGASNWFDDEESYHREAEQCWQAWLDKIQDQVEQLLDRESFEDPSQRLLVVAIERALMEFNAGDQGGLIDRYHFGTEHDRLGALHYSLTALDRQWQERHCQRAEKCNPLAW